MTIQGAVYMNLKAVKGATEAAVLILALLAAQFSGAQNSQPGSAPAASSSQPQASQKTEQKQSGSSSSLPSAPAPAQSSQEPSLQDLGFSQQQTQSNPALQARLNRRTEMLKIHQRLGLITIAPMAAALITGPMAKAKGRNGQIIKEPTSANLDMHAALGSATAALYFATAYYAMFAPRIPGERKRGAIRMHEALAFIHGPGMILTPILGAMAFNQEQNGEKVHGIASAHGTVATVTVLAYGASIVAVAWPIHLKFWEKR
jgi:flagellar motor protein MotB